MAITWEHDPARSRVVLAGALTGEDDLGSLFRSLAGATVLDLYGITRISSAGARSWASAMRELGESVSLTLDRCSVAVVCHLAINPRFRGSAGVRSVQVPHRCPACGNVQDIVLDLPISHLMRSDLACPCGDRATADVDETSYLEGLSSLS
jgi:hypothetical protein